MLWKFSLLVIYSLLLIFPRDMTVAATNRTIDDEFGDSETGLKPVFLPTTPGAWEGETCTGCGVKPDKALALQQTFNAATFRPEIGPISIGLSFTGTAVYVFFIIANFVATGVTTLTECNFTLDGQHAGHYRHEPSTSTDYQYNVLAFSTTGLPNVDHNLNISTSGVDYHVYVNFDYAIYIFDDTATTITSSSTTTTPQPTSSSNQLTSNPNQQSTGQSTQPTGASTGTQPIGAQQSTSQYSSTLTSTISSAASQLDGSNKPPVGAIVGGVMGGLVVLGLLLLLLFCWRRKRPIKIKSAPPPSLSSYDASELTVNAGPLNSGRSLDPTSTLSSSQYIRGEVPNNVENTNSSAITSDILITPQSPVNEARSIGRAHLERELRAVERELTSLRTRQSISSRQRSIHKPTDTNSETAELRRQIVQMREQIEYLRLQNPADPPPDYSEERSA